MALGPLVQATTTSSIKKLISLSFKDVEEVAALTVDSWVRASSIAEICPREEVLVSRHKLVRKREVDAGLNMTFEHGKALHYQLQNSILPRLGIILGEWACTACGEHVGRQVPGVPIREWAVPKPRACACGADQFQYVEATFVNEEYRLTGHNDGFLTLLDRDDLGILEAKSIGDTVWEVVAVPNLNHVVQANIYMWLADLKWAKIIYWHKGGYGVESLVEHNVDRDEDLICTIKQNLESMWRGIKGGDVPSRVCAHSEAPRAAVCPVKKPCFE